MTTRTAALALRAPATGLALVRAGEERERRPREDLQVEPRRAALDVPDVELDPLVPRQPRAPVDLRPAREPGLDLEPAPLPRRVAVDLVPQRRARPDQAHIAADDVPELRELVERQPAQQHSNTGDPRV